MCKRVLDVPGDRASTDCGGDCLACIEEVENPTTKEPRYALFGSVNKQGIGCEPYPGQIISMHPTVEQAKIRAGFGDVYGRPLRWYVVIDREGGNVMAREDC